MSTVRLKNFPHIHKHVAVTIADYGHADPKQVATEIADTIVPAAWVARYRQAQAWLQGNVSDPTAHAIKYLETGENENPEYVDAVLDHAHENPRE